MKALASICAATTALAVVACGGSGDYVSKVDPYIGSGGHGHVFVGANVPNGMIQVGPQNIHKGVGLVFGVPLLGQHRHRLYAYASERHGLRRSG